MMQQGAGGMSQPPSGGPPPPQAMWGQQPAASMYQQAPPPQAMWGQQPAASMYGAPQGSAPTGGSDEVKTLWIGDLQYWMDENYVHSCFAQTGEVQNVKLIRDKGTGQLQGYGFIEFQTRSTAERVIQAYNGQIMPNTEQQFRLNWASAGEKRDDAPDYTIFVGDLAPDVTDYMLQEAFRSHYPSVKGAKVVTDKLTGRSKGYGFVKFGDANEQNRAMTEMNGMFVSTRPMRIGPASNKTKLGLQKDGGSPVAQTPTDPSNTTLFVGGIDMNINEEHLRQVFGTYGELVSVKIPAGKKCAFVQFANKACAEEALLMLQGTSIGGQSVRLSWGRSPTSKQTQQDGNQWGGAAGYYGAAAAGGYGQGGGYEAYGAAYGAAPQDPYAAAAAYGAASYAAYPNYSQQQHQQPQQ